jgi:small subunit ribosomal protein S9
MALSFAALTARRVLLLPQHQQLLLRQPLTTIRSFASAPSPFRLRRPTGRLNTPSSSAQQEGQTRPNAITLFPGDFEDDAESLWDDDDDDWGNTNDGTSAALEDDQTDLLIQDLRRREAERLVQREKWLQNSIPPVHVSQIDPRGRAYGRGGRKRAQARVWIQAGSGQVVVNQRPMDEYFARATDRELLLAPLVATETCGAMDVQVLVRGGGLTGQAGAVRQGLSNALNHYDPDAYRPSLKKLGYLERDARKVERKKIGHIKARKSPQWVRR